jgi:uridylate kinase
MRYKRVLLKLSGEVLGGKSAFGLDHDALKFFVSEIKSLVEENIQIAVVIGGGNIFRGKELIEHKLIDRCNADYMGMLATAINGIALSTALKNQNVKNIHFTAFSIQKIGRSFQQEEILEALNNGHVLIFSCGTSNPLFTTDSAAALRAVEINADVLLKGTKVDGIYNKDPMKYPDAKKYKYLNYSEVIQQELQVMDMTAFTICKENLMPIRVFNILEKGSLLNVIENKNVGTLVHE